MSWGPDDCCCDFGTDMVSSYQYPITLFFTYEITATSTYQRSRSTGSTIRVIPYQIGTSLSQTIGCMSPDQFYYLDYDSGFGAGPGVEKWGLRGDLIWKYTDSNLSRSTSNYTPPINDKQGNIYYAMTWDQYDPINVTHREIAKIVKLDSNGNEIWTTSKIGSYGPPSTFPGYNVQGISVLDNGNIHVTGYFTEVVEYDTVNHFYHSGTLRFEWQVDNNGSEVWSVIGGTTGTGPIPSNSYGFQCAGDRDNNVHCAYSPSSDDSYLTLVGYDSSGSTLYEYTTGDFGSLSVSQVIPFEDKIYLSLSSSANQNLAGTVLRRYSGSLWATQDWTKTVNSFHPVLDTNGDLYFRTGTGFGSIFWKKIQGTDGSELFSVSEPLFGSQGFVYPGEGVQFTH